MDGVGEERENYGAAVGVGREGWRTSEQKVETEAKTCAHTCVSLRKPLHQLYLRVLLSKPRKVLILMELSIYICTVGSFFLTKYHFERE